MFYGCFPDDLCVLANVYVTLVDECWLKIEVVCLQKVDGSWSFFESWQKSHECIN